MITQSRWLTVEILPASARVRLSSALPKFGNANPPQAAGGLRRSTVAKVIDDPSNVSNGVAAAGRTFWCIDGPPSAARRPRGLRAMRTTPHGHGYDPTPDDEHVRAVTTHHDLCACTSPVRAAASVLGVPWLYAGILQDRQYSVAALTATVVGDRYG
jgi:hypothetical protein